MARRRRVTDVKEQSASARWFSVARVAQAGNAGDETSAREIRSANSNGGGLPGIERKRSRKLSQRKRGQIGIRLGIGTLLVRDRA